jgi:uncharacterized protein (TIGR02001 family)
MLLATATAAVAEDDGWMLPGTFTGNVAVTNDYVFRGFTQTQENAAIQGGFDWDSGHGFYLGTWASNFQFGAPGEGSVEWDVYGGYKGTLGKFTYDVGAIGYLYPGTDKALNYQWWEASAKVGYDFGVAAVSGGISYTPDYFGGLEDSWYYAGKLLVPVGVEGLTVDGTIGLQDLKGPFADTVDYSIGVTYAMKWFTTDVRFIDTDGPAATCRRVCDSRVVVKISRSF